MGISLSDIYRLMVEITVALLKGNYILSA